MCVLFWPWPRWLLCELCVIGVIVCVYLSGKPPWSWPRLGIVTMTCVCVCWPWPRLVIIDNKNIASMCVCVCVCFGLGLGWLLLTI